MKQMKFREFLEVRDDDDWRLIDVREDDEWADAHVNFAEHHPLSRIRQGDLPEDDGRKVALICAAGGRSAMAAQILEQRGFGETLNISDGTMGVIATANEYIER